MTWCDGAIMSTSGINDLPNRWQIYIVKFWTLVHPSLGPIFIFTQFLGNFGQIIGSRPPPLPEILDWPLLTDVILLLKDQPTYLPI